MIVKMHPGGKSFCRAVFRLLGHTREAGEPHRVPWTETRNLATDDPRLAARQMAAFILYAPELKRLAGVSGAGRPLEYPVYHYTLYWGRDERPGPIEMRRAVDESLAALGLEDHQAVVVAHTAATASHHVHVVVNRVSYEDGRAAAVYNSWRWLDRWAERWEREHGGLRCKRRAEHTRQRRLPDDPIPPAA